MVDIDGDFVISKDDADTFLERINYIVADEES